MPIDALTPIDYHIDVFAARFKAWWYCTFHWSCRIYEEWSPVKYRGQRQKCTCIAVVSGSILDKSLRVKRIYYGELQLPIETYQC